MFALNKTPSKITRGPRSKTLVSFTVVATDAESGLTIEEAATTCDTA